MLFLLAPRTLHPPRQPATARNAHAIRNAAKLPATGNGPCRAMLACQTTMTALLFLASLLLVGAGLAHSYLGERYILIPLLRRPDALPRLFGGTDFTVRVLRLAWHATSVAWWGFAAVLVLPAQGDASPRHLAAVVAATFLLTGAMVLIGSRGRHLAWIVFLAVGAIGLYAALAA